MYTPIYKTTTQKFRLGTERYEIQPQPEAGLK